MPCVPSSTSKGKQGRFSWQILKDVICKSFRIHLQNPSWSLEDFPSGSETNIFTAFRGIIYDFSIPGALVISFFTGFLGSIIYMKASSGKFVAMILLSMIYAFIFYSPLISIFHYNSILISWIIAFIIFIINKKSKYASTYLAYHR